MNFIIIIPARFFSSRFPGKLLADLHGKPMIIRVIEKALLSKSKKIIVATDNMLIKQAIELEYCDSTNALVEVCFTKSTHTSGTDRLLEVVNRYQFPNDQVILNLQGDEPLISLSMMHNVVQTLLSHNSIDVATLATPIRSLEEAMNTNIVKVVMNMYNDALYFSRSIIPWRQSYNNLDYTSNMLFRHIGIYSYRVNFFYRYAKWSKSPLEQLETLEQLRVLWNGGKIRVSIINSANNISVDTPESLKRVNELYANKYI